MFKLAIFLLATPVLAQPAPAAHDAGMQVDSLLDAAASPDGRGHVVRVIRDGTVVYDRAVGLANVALGTPLTADTPVYLASVGKTFTAAVVLRLAERGVVDLDASVRLYLPELPDYTDPVTIRSMLTHTSGLVDHYDLLAGEPGGLTNELVVALVGAQDSLLFEPGTDVRYSNAAYVLLSLVVERATDRTFADVLTDEIFDPLGMTSAVVVDDRQLEVPCRAVGYSVSDAGITMDDYRSFTTGAGGLYASIEDLTAWDAGIDRLLSPASRDLMWSVPTLPPGRRTPYGMGWLVECAPRGPLAGLGYVASTGSLHGFRTFLQRFESPRLTVIVLSNGGDWLPPFGIADLYLAAEWTPTDGADC